MKAMLTLCLVLQSMQLQSFGSTFSAPPNLGDVEIVDFDGLPVRGHVRKYILEHKISTEILRIAYNEALSEIKINTDKNPVLIKKTGSLVVVVSKKNLEITHVDLQDEE